MMGENGPAEANFVPISRIPQCQSQIWNRRPPFSLSPVGIANSGVRLNFIFRFPHRNKNPMPARKTNDLPFPSFSLAMSQYSTSDMRLPTYRTSHLLRFHPYPRTKLSSREIVMVSHANECHFSAIFDTCGSTANHQ